MGQYFRWSVKWFNRFFYSRAHAGEVSFPGGKCEPSETIEETALRETFEELGIPVDQFDIWDRLRAVRDKQGNVDLLLEGGICKSKT